MNVQFKFPLGQSVVHTNGIGGVVIAASKGRGDVIGYWLEYVNGQGTVCELYATEDQLS